MAKLEKRDIHCEVSSAGGEGRSHEVALLHKPSGLIAKATATSKLQAMEEAMEQLRELVEERDKIILEQENMFDYAMLDSTPLKSHTFAVIKLLDGDHEWGQSTFPHPLVTFDYNKQGELYRITAVRTRVMLVDQEPPEPDDNKDDDPDTGWGF